MVSIKFYPGRFDDAGMREVEIFAMFLEDKAPRLSAWFSDVVTTERQRRQNADEGNVQGPELPEMDLLKWSNTDVAQALVIACARANDNWTPTALPLMKAVHNYVIAAASCRLKSGPATI